MDDAQLTLPSRPWCGSAISRSARASRRAIWRSTSARTSPRTNACPACIGMRSRRASSRSGCGSQLLGAGDDRRGERSDGRAAVAGVAVVGVEGWRAPPAYWCAGVLGGLITSALPVAHGRSADRAGEGLPRQGHGRRDAPGRGGLKPQTRQTGSAGPRSGCSRVARGRRRCDRAAPQRSAAAASSSSPPTSRADRARRRVGDGRLMHGLNGDILTWKPVTRRRHERSSIGHLGRQETLRKQLELTGQLDFLELVPPSDRGGPHPALDRRRHRPVVSDDAPAPRGPSRRGGRDRLARRAEGDVRGAQHPGARVSRRGLRRFGAPAGRCVVHDVA
jgi:hypothetical protein